MGNSMWQRSTRALGALSCSLEFACGKKQHAGLDLRVSVRQVEIAGARVLPIGVDRIALQLVGLGKFVVRVRPLGSRLHSTFVFDQATVGFVLRHVRVAASDVRLGFRLWIARARANPQQHDRGDTRQGLGKLSHGKCLSRCGKRAVAKPDTVVCAVPAVVVTGAITRTSPPLER